MNAGMKMMMVSAARNRKEENNSQDRSRSDMRYGADNNDMRYGMNKKYETSNYKEPEDAYRSGYNTYAENRGYKRDRQGRFMPKNENMMEFEYEYQSPSQRRSLYNREERMENRQPMNKIGFESRNEVEQEYKSYSEYPHMYEMEHRPSQKEMGYARQSDEKGEWEEEQKFTKEMAEQWMKNLKNKDESSGPHWDFQKMKKVIEERGIKGDPLQIWVVMNSMYADYCHVFKKYGMGENLDFYIDMTNAFIHDKDAKENKVLNYFNSIVKK